MTLIGYENVKHHSTIFLQQNAWFSKCSWFKWELYFEWRMRQRISMHWDEMLLFRHRHLLWWSGRVQKSILIVFMRKCVCQKYVKTIKSLPWIKTKKFDRIFVNVLVTHFDIYTFCRKTIQFFVWTWHVVLWGYCMQMICMCLQNKQHKLCAYGENVWLHTQ